MRKFREGLEKKKGRDALLPPRVLACHVHLRQLSLPTILYFASQHTPAGLARLFLRPFARSISSFEIQRTKKMLEPWQPIEGKELPKHLQSLNDMQLKG